MSATGRQSAEDRRRAVLEAALPEFAVGGLAGTSTDSIAKRAGISQPYLFRLFPTKKQLFLASVEQTFETVRAAFEAAAEGRTGQAALEAMGNRYSEFLADRQLLMHQMNTYAACDDREIREVAREGFRRLWRTVETVSGASTEELRLFFAMGMYMNVVAALDLRSVDAQWASDCIPLQALPD